MSERRRRENRYLPITASNIERSWIWDRVPDDLKEAIRVVSCVLPFRTNSYVVQELIDWDALPDDPIFQLTFVQPGMLEPDHYRRIQDLLAKDAGRGELHRAVQEIRLSLNPHPAGQKTHNVPTLEGRPVPGIQHKYRDTVLFFPAQGQTCHAYCTYCFRWAQFVDLPEMRFESREADGLVAYLTAHPEVSDVLITGGDPLIMKTGVLRRYVEPLLDERLEHVRHIRVGSKALSYWPYRFTRDRDADDLLRLFDAVTASGRHLAFMAHVSHPRELATAEVERAVARIRATGAEIRTQAPLVARVNDDPEIWSEMWSRQVRLGMVPYYMFVERDTGPRNYFEVPLVRAHAVFREAFRTVSGLAATVRGPSMSAQPGKVRILGTADVGGRRVLTLDFLRARNPEWVGRPFFARLDPSATWLDQLRPAFGESRFFFEDGPGDGDFGGGARRIRERGLPVLRGRRRRAPAQR